MDIQAFSDELIHYGRQERMQDLAILPSGTQMEVIFSKSYLRKTYQVLTNEEAQQLITRFKFLGGMEVGERRRAQLGAVSYPLGDQLQRLRISTVGDYQGRESLVMRFLYPLTQEHLRYFFAEDVQQIQQATKQRGLYLFSGPTGSGKSTLMYQLARATKGQIITIEDPVEIEEPRFLQLQTNLKIEQDYDELIRLSLRHRPDLLLIGEIRNKETAQAAVRAALTGHRVFATIHARGVVETKTRLLELLGTDDRLAHALQGIIYQRLLPNEANEPHGLLAYHFYEGQVEKQWQHVLKQVKESGWISDEVYEKEAPATTPCN